ncbi:MAG: low affinity iron permease family protein [Polyangiaceae bacterium]
METTTVSANGSQNPASPSPTRARSALRSAIAGRAPYSGNEFFHTVASKTAHSVGSPWAFVIATSTVVVWALTGPIFHFSDTWQLVINTGTTIVTFLMVFLIQNTQNRDSHAIHLKLAELIRVNEAARNRLICAEELSEHELQELQDEFDRLAREKIARRSNA